MFQKFMRESKRLTDLSDFGRAVYNSIDNLFLSSNLFTLKNSRTLNNIAEMFPLHVEMKPRLRELWFITRW